MTRSVAIVRAPSNIGIRPYDNGEPRLLDRAPGVLRDQGLVARLGAVDFGDVVPPYRDFARPQGRARDECELLSIAYRWLIEWPVPQQAAGSSSCSVAIAASSSGLCWARGGRRKARSDLRTSMRMPISRPRRNRGQGQWPACASGLPSGAAIRPSPASLAAFRWSTTLMWCSWVGAMRLSRCTGTPLSRRHESSIFQMPPCRHMDLPRRPTGRLGDWRPPDCAGSGSIWMPTDSTRSTCQPWIRPNLAARRLIRWPRCSRRWLNIDGRSAWSSRSTTLRSTRMGPARPAWSRCSRIW